MGIIALYNRPALGSNLDSILPMIDTQGAVVLGMVYNYLPFMILPIYSVIVQAGSLALWRRHGTWAPTR